MWHESHVKLPLTLVSYLMCLQKGNGDKYRYGGWWSVWWTGTYSMVLSKAAFFHKKYFSLYTYEMPASIREYVTKNRFFLLTNRSLSTILFYEL